MNETENLAEVVLYHSLESDIMSPAGMANRLEAERDRIRTGKLDKFYQKDLVPFQAYGGVGEENIPLRYQNFITRIGQGVKEVTQLLDGFDAIVYPLSGVDLSAVVPFLKDDSVLITLDNDDPFYRGYRPDQAKASELDRVIAERDMYEKTTHGMHSVELSRDAGALAGELQLAGFDPEKGDQFRVVEEKIGPQIQEGFMIPKRKKTKVQMVVGGKKISWTHYQMNVGPDTLSKREKNQEVIWQDLRKDLVGAFSKTSCMVLSKAGMDSVLGIAIARSGLLQPGNFVCIDSCYEPGKELPGVRFSRIQLDNLKDISPQFDFEYQKTHKLIYPYINFGHQNDPAQIFLAKVE